MCSQLLDLQDVETGNALEELTAVLEKGPEDGNAGGAVPAWLKVLRESASKWLEQAPESIKKLKETPDSIKNPLFRFMRREILLGGRVLDRIHEGLNALIQFVDGEIKATNDLRQLFAKLAKEQVPKQWLLFTVDDLGISHWLIDFVKRTTQLSKIAETDYVTDPRACLWLGGLFSPEGFVAATRQYVAQQNKWPLESLKLNLEIGQSQPKANTFVFEGLTLYGAGWDKQSGCLVLTDKTQTQLPASRFVWAYTEQKKDETDSGKAADIVTVSIPVYLNSSFKQLLFSVHLPVFSSLPSQIWTQRAVSISVWSS
jgi:dynein heavy chain 1